MVLASPSKYIGDRQNTFPLFNFERFKPIVKLKIFQQTTEKTIKTEVQVKPDRY